MIDRRPQREREQSGFPLLITLDSTPTASFLIQIEKIRQHLPNKISAQYSLLERNLTPLGLLNVNIPRVVMTTSQSVCKCYEAFASAYSHKKINVVCPTPITSLAWSIFMAKMSVIDVNRAKTEINYFKSTLTILGSRIKDIDTLHMINLIEPESVLIQDQLILSPDNKDILLSRLDVFNTCLETATRIGSKYLGKKIVPFFT